MKKNHFVITYSFLITFSVGCATFHKKPLSPSQTAEAFDARTLNDPGLQRFLAKHGHGDRHQGDRLPPLQWDLDSLTLAALYYHPDLDVARAQWAAAQAGERTAKEIPNPSLTLGPGQYVSNAASGISPWIWGFSLDIPVETAGKRGIRRHQAAALAEAVRLNIAQTAWQIRSRVRTSVLAFDAARQSETILRRRGKELSENARLLTERSAGGRASPLGAAQAVVLAGQDRVALEEAVRKAIDARAQLAGALAVPLRALEGIQISNPVFSTLPDPGEAALSNARRSALLSRPDILAALAGYAASEDALRLEIAKQYPDLHLGPGFTYDQGQDKWGLGLTLPLPIFSRNRGPIAEAEARREEVAAQFLALQDRIINDVDRALAGYKAAYQKLRAADEVLAAHLKRDKSLRRLLRDDDVSRLSLFRSRLDLESTELARVEAFNETRSALGALEDALERPLLGQTVLPSAAVEVNPREPGR